MDFIPERQLAKALIQDMPGILCAIDSEKVWRSNTWSGKSLAVRFYFFKYPII